MIQKHKIQYDQNDLIIIDNLLNDKEITLSINLIEKLKEISKNNTKSDGKSFNYNTDFFNYRYPSHELSDLLYEKVKPHLSEFEDETGKWKPTKACNYIFMAKYNPNKKFNIHTDTGCYSESDKRSTNTMLIYLNDDFQGGETSFYDLNFKHIISVKPKKGRAIIFNINLWHSGEEVKDNNKLWIGTEIVSKRL
jgi:hypothetical protein